MTSSTIEAPPMQAMNSEVNEEKKKAVNFYPSCCTNCDCTSSKERCTKDGRAVESKKTHWTDCLLFPCEICFCFCV
ncbi:unnamed protein product [Microthlaspi erraticum]|uniref:Uncharacterized protein n=1 Tax=Microthlaspi erraticum TaxID=1685480 RepID=A0A6D2LMA7_9BRAS|nr:unnamed protein product [Microthlaspi erraticum]